MAARHLYSAAAAARAASSRGTTPAAGAAAAAAAADAIRPAPRELLGLGAAPDAVEKGIPEPFDRSLPDEAQVTLVDGRVAGEAAHALAAGVVEVKPGQAVAAAGGAAHDGQLSLVDRKRGE